MEFLEFKELYFNLEKRYLDIYKYLDLDAVNKSLMSLKEETLKENFWTNWERARCCGKKGQPCFADFCEVCFGQLVKV